jgi:antitoxin component YwqK of YwqJK toxin-antitoxin module
MKYTFYTIIVISALLACSSKSKEIVQNYGTGQVSRRYIEVNHKKEGLMTDYYPSGKLKAERMFKNDIQVDKTTFYYESGKIKEVQYFANGKINGGDSVFYENGKPQFLLNFTDGIKDGYVRKWAEDGTMTFEAKYDKGNLVEVKGEPISPDSIPHLKFDTQEEIEKREQ